MDVGCSQWGFEASTITPQHRTGSAIPNFPDRANIGGDTANLLFLWRFFRLSSTLIGPQTQGNAVNNINIIT